jgi:hypothetical protein
MQIHLFISDSAPSRNRLKAKLQDILLTGTVIKYQNPDAFGRIIPRDYNETVASVIMAANTEELSRLAQIKFFWDRSKNILILPDKESETIKLAHKIRPVFMTSMDSDFSEVVLILEHITHRFSADIQPDQSRIVKYKSIDEGGYQKCQMQQR